ncbi:MAG TPA: TIM barrel protein [Candidatus Limnocylindria bacterium]|nr:TIM barrel protein [Candidatus Limnocylindria bacterium]
MIPERFAANVAWLFTNYPWHKRFAAARDAGFTQVEFPWPDDPAATAAAVHAAGIGVALLNMPAGDLAAGERGWPNDPSRIEEWRAAVGEALGLARGLGCAKVNVLAGNAVSGISSRDQLACVEENLRWALPLAASAGVTLVTELLNRRENPSYLLVTLDDAEPLLDALRPLGWKLQLDTWHLGLTVGDVPAAIRRAGSNIGHVQVADVPGRHEPGTGSLDWGAIRAALDDAGYAGSIGLEFTPRGSISPAAWPWQ